MRSRGGWSAQADTQRPATGAWVGTYLDDATFLHRLLVGKQSATQTAGKHQLHRAVSLPLLQGSRYTSFANFGFGEKTLGAFCLIWSQSGALTLINRCDSTMSDC